MKVYLVGDSGVFDLSEDLLQAICKIGKKDNKAKIENLLSFKKIVFL